VRVRFWQSIQVIFGRDCLRSQVLTQARARSLPHQFNVSCLTGAGCVIWPQTRQTCSLGISVLGRNPSRFSKIIKPGWAGEAEEMVGQIKPS
jgi:hypothetical protein